MPIGVETELEFVEAFVVDKTEAVAFKLTVKVLFDETERPDKPVGVETEVLWPSTEAGDDLVPGSAAVEILAIAESVEFDKALLLFCVV